MLPTFEQLYSHLPKILNLIQERIPYDNELRNMLFSTTTNEHSYVKAFATRFAHVEFMPQNPIFYKALRANILYMHALRKGQSTDPNILYTIYRCDPAKKDFGDFIAQERLRSVSFLTGYIKNWYLERLIERQTDEKKKKTDLEAMKKGKLALLKIKSGDSKDHLTYMDTDSSKSSSWFDDVYPSYFPYQTEEADIGAYAPDEKQQFSTEIQSQLAEAGIQAQKIEINGNFDQEKTAVVEGINNKTGHKLIIEVSEDRGTGITLLTIEDEETKEKEETTPMELIKRHKEKEMEDKLKSEGYDLLEQPKYNSEAGEYTVKAKDKETGESTQFTVSHDEAGALKVERKLTADSFQLPEKKEEQLTADSFQLSGKFEIPQSKIPQTKIPATSSGREPGAENTEGQQKMLLPQQRQPMRMMPKGGGLRQAETGMREGTQIQGGAVETAEPKAQTPSFRSQTAGGTVQSKPRQVVSQAPVAKQGSSIPKYLLAGGILVPTFGIPTAAGLFAAASESEQPVAELIRSLIALLQ